MYKINVVFKENFLKFVMVAKTNFIQNYLGIVTKYLLLNITD